MSILSSTFHFEYTDIGIQIQDKSDENNILFHFIQDR